MVSLSKSRGNLKSERLSYRFIDKPGRGTYDIEIKTKKRVDEQVTIINGKKKGLSIIKVRPLKGVTKGSDRYIEREKDADLQQKKIAMNNKLASSRFTIPGSGAGGAGGGFKIPGMSGGGGGGGFSTNFSTPAAAASGAASGVPTGLTWPPPGVSKEDIRELTPQQRASAMWQNTSNVVDQPNIRHFPADDWVISDCKPPALTASANDATAKVTAPDGSESLDVFYKDGLWYAAITGIPYEIDAKILIDKLNVCTDIIHFNGQYQSATDKIIAEAQQTVLDPQDGWNIVNDYRLDGFVMVGPSEFESYNVIPNTADSFYYFDPALDEYIPITGDRIKQEIRDAFYQLSEDADPANAIDPDYLVPGAIEPTTEPLAEIETPTETRTDNQIIDDIAASAAGPQMTEAEQNAAADASGMVDVPYNVTNTESPTQKAEREKYELKYGNNTMYVPYKIKVSGTNTLNVDVTDTKTWTVKEQCKNGVKIYETKIDLKDWKGNWGAYVDQANNSVWKYTHLPTGLKIDQTTTKYIDSPWGVYFQVGVRCA